MFHLLPKNLFFLPSRRSFSSSQVRRLLTPLSRLRKNLFCLPSRSSYWPSQVQVREFSSSPFLPRSLCKRLGENEYKVRVSVLWDFNSCPVPSGVSYLKVPPSIMGALRTNGFKGPIHIEAYGNVYQLSDINQETLFLNGIDLHHIPGGKNNSHRYLKNWISKNPPPAHLFLISGDRDPDFLRMVRHLSLNHYKILFACPGSADDYLCAASTTKLEWSLIVNGKYLIGKDFKLDNDTDRPEDVRFEIMEKNTTSQNPSSCNDYTVLENNYIANCEFRKAENKHENPSRKEVDEIFRSPCSSPVDNPLVEKKRHDRSAETYSKSSTFFNWISSWWTFWKSSTKSDDLTANRDVIHSRKPELFEDSKLAEVDHTFSHFEEPKSSEPQQDVSHSGIHELFSTGSFWWDVVESFVFTPRGSRLVSKSRSREDLALKLRKHGPPFLRCLTENDILQLVELLIAEKKWLEENTSQAFPFRLNSQVV